jgi:energy-coupling factor transporter ATP-binding protein EcfA2
MFDASLDYDKKRLSNAASAVVLITGSRESIRPIPRFTWDRWRNASQKDIEDILSHKTRAPYATRVDIAFLHASSCASKAIELNAHDEYIASITSLVDAIFYTAKDNTISQSANHASALVARELLALQRHPRRNIIRAELRRIIDNIQDNPSDASIQEALGLDWNSFHNHLLVLRKGIAPTFTADDIGSEKPIRSSVSVAHALTLRPVRLPDSSPSAYDNSDKDIRVSKVNLRHFRGSPGDLSLDLAPNGRSLSAIILGDNGSGKSTIADSIEFALQGRIGRSIAFDGSLAPSAKSFATADLAEVTVTLNNDTSISRRLESKSSGRLGVDIEHVRPGFRLAPISLKRQDILRFLDTGAMARGHVFFDYFPVNASEMAIRPEEFQARLDDEDYELRIRRTSLSEALGAELDVEPQELANRDNLETVVKNKILNGQSIAQAKRDGRWDQVPESVRESVTGLMQTQKRLRAIKNEKSRGIMTKNPVLYRAQAAILSEALGGIGDLLTSAFMEITSASYVSRIDVIFGGSGPVSLDIIVKLSSGIICFPQQVFSEGYRDLLAILFFLAVAKRACEKGQARVLILDDIFQSVDSGIRSGTVEYILREFHDWQLLFTVHDRLWFEQLTAALKRHQHKFIPLELKRWRFDTGIVASTPGDFRSNLNHQLSSGDPVGICGAAGLLLEQASDQLSWRLGTSIKRAKQDKYTLGALWPGIAKDLRRKGLREIVDRIDRLYVLRNLAGAHFNEWAGTLSREEAENFGEAVLDLVNSTWCSACNDWVSSQGEALRCHCGLLVQPESTGATTSA